MYYSTKSASIGVQMGHPEALVINELNMESYLRGVVPVEMDEVHTVAVDDGPIRFDPNSSPHDHFVCRVCGAISDVSASRVAPLAGIPTTGYEVEATEGVFRGRCPECVDHL